MIDWDGLVIGPCLGAFGEPVIYSPADGVSFPITGVFDDAFLAQAPIEGLTSSNVMSYRPTLGVQLSQFTTDPAQDDVLRIVRTGQTYMVGSVRPDGHGWARLVLNDFVPGVPV